jgi:hypothetical protein
MGEVVDRETLHTAAAAGFPQLALLALRWMRDQPMDGDDGAAAAALESRSAGVRSAALAFLGDRLPPEVQKLGDWILAESYSQDETLVPDTEPDADLLGFTPYPGAHLVRLASGKKRAFYTTSDPPDKVVAAIGKGKKILDAGDYYERVTEAITPPDMDALQAEMEKMMTETDPEKLEAMQAGLEKMMQPQSNEFELLSGVGQAMIHSEARVVILRETPSSSPGAPAQARRIAAVFHDDALEATVILVPLE